MSATVQCTCDTCGKFARCRHDEPAPAGWFYLEILDHPGDTAPAATALACSEACKMLPWKRRPRQRRRAS